VRLTVSDIEPAGWLAENWVDENSTAAGPVDEAALCCVAEAVVEAADAAPLVAAEVLGAPWLQAESSNENVTARTPAKDFDRIDRIARIFAPYHSNS
jgi:hypothetical protein